MWLTWLIQIDNQFTIGEMFPEKVETITGTTNKQPKTS
jgi:hypothetical protein